MNTFSNWIITREDRVKHDEQFQFLRPINGFISGEQGKIFFMRSGLPPPVLGHIWSLADLSSDGKLDKREFSIAMFLIKKQLEKCELPDKLPPSLLQEPQVIMPNLPASDTYSFQNNVSQIVEDVQIDNNNIVGDWSVKNVRKPRYCLQFNQNDVSKKGYLTGMEAKAIFNKSRLPQNVLAQIWNLADCDHDGNLSCDEFCIAAFLIEQSLANQTLPTAIPSHVVSRVMAQKNGTPSTTNNINQISENKNSTEGTVSMTFEDKRKQNLLQGQAELERRQRELSAQLRREEEERQEKFRIEQERLEKIRIEQEKERLAEEARKQERQRILEQQLAERRRQAHEARVAESREREKQRALDVERSRIEMLRQQIKQMELSIQQTNSHKAKLKESEDEQQKRREEVVVRWKERETACHIAKKTIEGMRPRRDQLEHDIRTRLEQIEAAKVELSRFQHEREQLSLQAVNNVSAQQVEEAAKTLTSNIQSRKDRLTDLKSKINDFDEVLAKNGELLAKNRNQFNSYDENFKNLISDTEELRRKLLDKSLFTANAFQDPFALAFSPSTATTEMKTNGFEMLKDQTTSKWYQAIYPFHARQEDELTFEVGAKIHVPPNKVSDVGEGWLCGECNGKYGLFPENYVTPLQAETTGDSLFVNFDTSEDPFAINKPLDLTLDKVDSGTTFGITSSIFDNVSSDLFADMIHSTTDPFLDPIFDTKTTESEQQKTDDTLFYCRAIYPYESTVEGDLSFHSDDIIRVYSDKLDWWQGSLLRNHKHGMFPANYAEKLDSNFKPPSYLLNGNVDVKSPIKDVDSSLWDSVGDSSVNKASWDSTNLESTSIQSVNPNKPPEIARVVIAYQAQGEGQLSLATGQLVKIRKKSARGWWEGELQDETDFNQRGQKRRVGWFPFDYVKVLTSNSVQDSSLVLPSRPVTTIQPVTSQSVEKSPNDTENSTETITMKALYEYKAMQEDELTFEKGDIILVISRDEPEWWRGRLISSGKEGLFPVNYVEQIQMSNIVGGTQISDKKLKQKTSSGEYLSGESRPKSLLITASLETDSLPLPKILSVNSIPVHNKIEEVHRRRILAITELCNTEKSYINSLEFIRDNYVVPIKHKQLMTEDEIKAIFLNINELLNINLNFYRDLMEKYSNENEQLSIKYDTLVGGLFIKYLDALETHYRSYCERADEAAAKLEQLISDRPDLKSFIETSNEDPLPLTSHIIKPVQRIIRYQLLIQSIMENTNIDSSFDANGILRKDFEDLKHANTKILSILQFINKSTRIRQNEKDLIWLRSNFHYSHVEFSDKNCKTGWGTNRCLIQAGPVRCMKLLNKKETPFLNRELIMFLFTDMIYFLVVMLQRTPSPTDLQKTDRGINQPKFDSKRIFAPYFENYSLAQTPLRQIPGTLNNLDDELTQKIASLQQEISRQNDLVFVSSDLKAFLSRSFSNLHASKQVLFIPFDEPIWLKDLVFSKSSDSLTVNSQTMDHEGDSQTEMDTLDIEDSYKTHQRGSFAQNFGLALQSATSKHRLTLKGLTKSNSDLKLYKKIDNEVKLLIKLRFGYSIERNCWKEIIEKAVKYVTER